MATGVQGISVGSFQTTLTNAEPTEYQIYKPKLGEPPQSPQMMSVAVKAMATNTGVIYIGGKGVTKETGYELKAGESIAMDLMSLVNAYAIGTKAGDKLCVLYTAP